MMTWSRWRRSRRRVVRSGQAGGRAGEIVRVSLIAVVALATHLPLSWSQSNADVNQLGFQTQDEAKNQRNNHHQHYDNDSSSF